MKAVAEKRLIMNERGEVYEVREPTKEEREAWKKGMEIASIKRALDDSLLADSGIETLPSDTLKQSLWYRFLLWVKNLWSK